MIKTENPGILEAVREVKIMGFGRNLRALHEARLKAKRDRYAEDAWVRDEGRRERMEEDIRIFIQSNRDDGISDEVIAGKLQKYYSLSETEAGEKLRE